MQTYASIRQFAAMLENLDRWLQAAAAHAQAKAFNPDVLVQARLAPDQYALVQQVQSASDAAKYAAAYLAGRSAPSHPDTETSLDQLCARVRTCHAYLGTFQSGDFAGAEERRVAPAWMQGKSVRGDHYLTRIAIPNFYFHTTMAYAILRHNGVALGKADFIGVKSWDEIAAWS